MQTVNALLRGINVGGRDKQSRLTMIEAQKAAIRTILTADSVWAAYALADLQPEFAPFCAWYPAADGNGLAMIYTGLPIATLFAAGAVASVAASVGAIALPERIYITLREEHFAIAERYYDFSNDVRPMRRMWLPVEQEMGPPKQSVVRMTARMSKQLRDLYMHGGDFAPDAFDGYQIDNGVFFGVIDGAGKLAAAGGTHIVDWTAGIGAIGNMYTRSDQRQRGYASTIVRAIVHELRAGGVTNIVLNVDQRNDAAHRLYRQHGFVEHCPYVEGIGRRRRQPDSIA
jgi:RimJ/RimL family protein N-acetyltransferase